MGGYVYLIYDENNATYKIGVTRKHDSTRIKKLQTGNSTQLKIVYMTYADYPFKLESMLHNFYKPYHVLNEWYELNEKQVENFPEKCKLYIENINALKENKFFVRNGLK